MNDAAKILRLLHIKDLRELQTQINAAIVAVQAITANPKTDSRLGQVGRWYLWSTICLLFTTTFCIVKVLMHGLLCFIEQKLYTASRLLANVA